MKTPDWTEPAHPITTHELSLWRKQRRVLWITFVILPLLVSSCMWSAFLSPRRILRPNDLLSALNLNIWGLQLFLGIWLGVIVTSRAATLIARERETRNWALLKTTPHIESEILSLKAQAIFYDLRWPISLVFSLRALSIVGSVAAAPLDSVGEAAQAAIFVVVFCADGLGGGRDNSLSHWPRLYDSWFGRRVHLCAVVVAIHLLGPNHLLLCLHH